MSEASQAERRDYVDEPYYWWYASDLEEFFATAGKYGYDNIYITIREVEDKNGEREAYFNIYDKVTGVYLGGYNDSHTCPPDCEGADEPGGGY